VWIPSRRRRPDPAIRISLESTKGLDKFPRGAFAPPVDLRVDALARDVARLLAELQAAGATGPDPSPFKL
jgi:hypothetical protein